MANLSAKLEVTLLPIRLEPDPTRVIGRRFLPGGEARIRGIIERIMAIPEQRVGAIVEGLKQRFEGRHTSIAEIVDRNYGTIEQYVPHEEPVSRESDTFGIG